MYPTHAGVVENGAEGLSLSFTPNVWDSKTVQKITALHGTPQNMVQSAVTQLRKSVPTKRARLEGDFPNLSDYGKLKCSIEKQAL